MDISCCSKTLFHFPGQSAAMASKVLCLAVWATALAEAAQKAGPNARLARLRLEFRLQLAQTPDQSQFKWRLRSICLQKLAAHSADKLLQGPRATQLLLPKHFKVTCAFLQVRSTRPCPPPAWRPSWTQSFNFVREVGALDGGLLQICAHHSSYQHQAPRTLTSILLAMLTS